MFPHGVYQTGEDGEGTIQFDEILEMLVIRSEK
jgi:hypothetical protein